MLCTRVYISQGVGVFSWFLANHENEHWATMNIAFRCFRGTSKYYICYHSNVSHDPYSMGIHVYVDSNWARDVNIRRSTSGYVFMIFGWVVTWMSNQ